MCDIREDLRELVGPHLNSLSEEELSLFKGVLETLQSEPDSAVSLLSSLYEDDYEEIPVSIDTFICDEKYLGGVYDGGNSVYPFWRDYLHRVFHCNPDNAFEQCISGAIGIGKSTVAAIALMYLMYRTLCLKDPRKFYGLTGNAPIVFVVLNLTLELAYSGLYSLIVESIRNSPWFMERVDIRGKYSYTISFPKGVEFMAGSSTTHTIGKNVLGAILDEINFSSAPRGSKKSVLSMYRNIRRRLESRFMREGSIPGLLMMISSKNDENDFLETYISSIRHQKSTWVVDEPIWNVKPPSTYTGETFPVAVGDKSRESKLLSSDETREEYESLGYRIIDVPIEYHNAFVQDLTDALKDIAGISSYSSNKLIPHTKMVYECFDTDLPRPFLVDEIILEDDEEEIWDYLGDLRLLKKDLHLPRFAHIDIGLTGDRLGLAVTYSPEGVLVERYTHTGAIDSLVERRYVVDFSIGLKAPKNGEIKLYKVRNFLRWLHTHIGFKFVSITFDGFQSADSIQLLKASKYPAGTLSVDRTSVPYVTLKSSITEHRVLAPKNKILIKELSELEYNRSTDKVDHPILDAEGNPGSKDISDAVCGSLYSAHQYYAEKGTKSMKRGSLGMKTSQQKTEILKVAQKVANNPNRKESVDWI